MAYEPDHEEFYRPDYAPIPRQQVPWWKVRESWVVLGGAVAGIVAAGAIIWLVLVVGFTLTEH